MLNVRKKVLIGTEMCIRDSDYTESILDQLYSKISAHNVDAAIVVTKGILSERCV